MNKFRPSIKQKFLISLVTMALSSHLAMADDDSELFGRLYQRVEQYSLSDISKAGLYLDSLRSVTSRHPDSNAFKAREVYMEVLINYEHGRNEMAIIPSIMEMKEQMGVDYFPFEHALLDYALSLIYCSDSDYTQSFMAALKASEQFNKIGNKEFESRSLTMQGIICSHIENYTLAEGYYRQALALAANPRDRSRIRLSLYTLRCLAKQDSSTDSLENVISELLAGRDTALICLGYANLGVCHATAGEFDRAQTCFEREMELIPAINNDNITFGLYQNLGAFHMYRDEPVISLKYINDAKNIAVRNDNQARLSLSHHVLSNIYKQLNNIDSAFYYLELYNDFTNSKLNKSRLIEAYQAHISTTLESTQKELTIAEQELELKNRGLLIVVTCSIGVILLITLLLIRVQQKRYRKESENKELEERLRNKQQIEKLQEERLEIQTRELTSNSLMLSNKNEVLQQIADIAKQIPEHKSEINDILNVIKKNQNIEQAWDNFTLHFEKVHPDFFNKLSAECKGLTKNDLRLCAYFRIGIAPKEIAQILNISPDSIRIHRFRIKKKLNLGDDGDFDRFIRNI